MRSWPAAFSRTAFCAFVAMAARKRNGWLSPVPQGDFLRGAAPRHLPRLRHAAHGSGLGPSGGPCHPEGSGAPMGAVIPDSLAQSVRRPSRLASPGVTDHPSRDCHVSLHTDRPEARSGRYRCRHPHPALRLSRQPEHPPACAGARWRLWQSGCRRHRRHAG